MKYDISGEFVIQGRGEGILVTFDKPQLRKDIITLIGTKINNREIISIEFAGLGENCYHKNAGLLLRNN